MCDESALMSQAPPNRLHMPGSTLNSGWQHFEPEEGGAAEAELYSCEMTLAGEAGSLVLHVMESDIGDRRIAAISHTLDLLSGEFCLEHSLYDTYKYSSLSIRVAGIQTLRDVDRVF